VKKIIFLLSIVFASTSFAKGGLVIPTYQAEPFNFNFFGDQGVEQHSCNVKNSIVNCRWRLRTDLLNEHPYQIVGKNIRELGLANRYSCFVDDNGVKCWGSKTEGQLHPPPMKNARGLIVRDEYACATGDEGVNCWGKSPLAEKTDIKNPKIFAVSSHYFGQNQYSCVIDDNGLSCWGARLCSSSYQCKNFWPDRVPAKDVAVGTNHACLLDSEGVKCWGEGQWGQLQVPPLKNPIRIVAQYDSTCAWDDEGVHCWGDTPFTPGIFLEDSRDFIFLNNLPVVIERFKRDAPAARSLFLSNFKGFVETNLTGLPEGDLARSEYFALRIISIPVLTVDSQIFTGTIATLNDSLKNIEIALKIRPSTKESPSLVSVVPKNELNIQIALHSLRAALSVGQNFMVSEERAKIETPLRLIGSALTDPKDIKKIADVLTAIADIEKEKMILSRSSRSAFLADVIDECTHWLREKAK
jgi:hypothetical protein